MSKDLYQTLGVPRDASKDQVKRAYRRKAKAHHPDKNQTTSIALWHDVQEAYETLNDDARRARYDQTGETSNNNTQKTPHTLALEQLAHIFLGLVDTTDTDHTNLVAEARTIIKDIFAKLESNKAQQKKKAAKLRRTAERFTVNDGADNFAAAILAQRASEIERGVSDLEFELTAAKEALAILDQLRYRTDKAPNPETEIISRLKGAFGSSIFTFSVTPPPT